MLPKVPVAGFANAAFVMYWMASEFGIAGEKPVNGSPTTSTTRSPAAPPRSRTRGGEAGERVADHVDAVAVLAGAAAVGACQDVERRAAVDGEQRIHLPAFGEARGEPGVSGKLVADKTGHDVADIEGAVAALVLQIVA